MIAGSYLLIEYQLNLQIFKQITNLDWRPTQNNLECVNADADYSGNREREN